MSLAVLVNVTQPSAGNLRKAVILNVKLDAYTVRQLKHDVERAFGESSVAVFTEL